MNFIIPDLDQQDAVTTWLPDLESTSALDQRSKALLMSQCEVVAKVTFSWSYLVTLKAPVLTRDAIRIIAGLTLRNGGPDHALHQTTLHGILR